MANRKQEFTFDSILFTGEHLSEDYDLSKMTLEVSLFEDIDKPYLSGQLVCMDDLAIFDEMALRGTERVKIKITVGEEDIPINLEMHVASIVNRMKANDVTEVYHINLVSPSAFLDQGIKISKSYTGKLDDIAEKVIKNHLQNVEISDEYAGNVAQSSVKIITPYISPLETAKWLLDRATEFSGAPFFLWQSIYEQDGKETFRIGDLESMVAKRNEVWNENKPLIYSQKTAMDVALEDTEYQKFVIRNMVSKDVSDTMSTMADGAVGARFSTLDTYTSQMFSRHFDSKEMLDRAGTNVMKVFNGTPEQNVVDEEKMMTYEGETKAIHEWDHRYFNTLTSYGTYGPWNSYHDDPRQLDAMNKMKSLSFHSLLNKNPLIAEISGSALIRTGDVKAGAGDVTRVIVLKSAAHDGSDNDYPIEDIVDENRSGYYLIKKCRHTFANTSHSVSCEFVKLNKGDNRTGSYGKGDTT